MIAFIDEQVRENCWNLYDSYGEICVHCGCCAKDKAERYRARIACVERWLDDRLNFDLWDDDPKLRAIQEKNVREDIRHHRRMLRYYKKRLAEVEAR